MVLGAAGDHAEPVPVAGVDDWGRVTALVELSYYQVSKAARLPVNLVLGVGRVIDQHDAAVQRGGVTHPRQDEARRVEEQNLRVERRITPLGRNQDIKNLDKICGMGRGSRGRK
ncbi:hypothetical protein scyTo_0026307 [Scyliorhinus torazame]|uniref:Uncharacterized protein n=1 Tax=Scyliorhinus torazame TaxID=75743 RepID=A0A401QK13_SCYTO|nr:hypothetical protein [Scyliorhinus torazame]